MKLKKKIAITTIAASVAMSAFAGIPLSNQGLAEKLGVSGVIYAATYSDFVTEANKIYTELAKIEDGVEDVNAFRAQIEAALTDPGSTILDPLITKLATIDDQELVKSVINDLLSIQINSTWQDEYEVVRSNSSEALKVVFPGIGIDDLASLFLEVEEKVAALVGNLTLEDLLELDTFKQQLRSAAIKAIQDNTAVNAALALHGIGETEFAEVYSNLIGSEEVTFQAAGKAFIALNKAYKAANPGPGPGPDPDPGPGPGPGPETPIALPPDVAELEGKLDELKGKLENATDEEKAELIAEATAEAQAVVDKLANIAASVTSVDGKATLQLDESATLSAIAGIAAVAKSLKDAVGAELPPLKVTFDLGDLEEAGIEVGLPTSVVEEAIKANLASVIFKAGDLSVELPVGGELNKAIDLSINRTDASEEITGSQTAVSQVYEFGLQVDGAQVTSFSKPILIALPIDNTSDIDTDLLSLAKIIQDKLEFYGGKYSSNRFFEARDTFSSYVVIENKVTFGDTTSVDAWAGRAIQVIAAKGAINGKSEGVFAPNDQVTRAEFAKMLIHALDLDNVNAKESFADVQSGDWFAPYVAAASENKIINGRTTTTFDPHANITRAEMATMVARALKTLHGDAASVDVDAALARFSDAGQVSASLKEGVAFAASNGIVVGYDGKFVPNGNATRAEAAVIIHRAFNFNG